MNENNIIRDQEYSPGKDENMVFVTRHAPRFSTSSFVLTSIILGLLIAIAVSFTPELPGGALVGAAIALIMSVVIIQKPEIGAYLLIITVFTNISDFATERGFPSINKPLVALTYVSIFINYFFRRGGSARLPRISRIEVFLLAYFFAIVLSLFLSPNNSDAFDLIINITKDILSGFCIVLALNTKEKWRTGMWILIIIMANIALVGVIKVISGTNFTFGGLAQLSILGQTDESGQLRYGGPIGEPNIWAQVLTSMIPLVVYRFTYEKNSFRKLNLAFAGFFILLAVIYTGSRGAFVGLISILPLMAFERKVRLPTLLSISLGIVILFMILPANYVKRFQSIGVLFDPDTEYNFDADTSFAGRRTEMLAGLAMFRDSPILGVGFGNYGINYWNYASELGLGSSISTIDPEDLPKAHSLYVEIISETGAVGLLAFGAFFIALFGSLLRIRSKNIKTEEGQEWSNWSTALFFSLLSFLISGIFLHGILWRYIWMLIGSAMGISAIFENRSTPDSGHPKTQPRTL